MFVVEIMFIVVLAQSSRRNFCIIGIVDFIYIDFK